MGNHYSSPVSRTNADEGITLLKEAVVVQFLRGRFVMDQALLPGSGRLMRTYRVRSRVTHNKDGVSTTNNTNNSSNTTPPPSQTTTVSRGQDASTAVAAPAAVVKCMWWTLPDNANNNNNNNNKNNNSSSLLRDHAAELTRIRTAVADVSHVAPFLVWWLGDSTRGTIARPLCLLRSYVYTTVADRLAGRPWLTWVEKVWIMTQLLRALQELHDQKIVHGHVTTENIGLTSAGWLVLLDIASYKPITALPDNDPSMYLYYFEREQQHNNVSSSGRTTTNNSNSNNSLDITSSSFSSRRCYLAPERFYTPTSSTTTNTTINTDETTAATATNTSVPASLTASSATTASLSSLPSSPPLTPAMDLFSAGCVMVEILLNGERCFDLGELLDYRRQAATNDQEQVLTVSLKQRLDKIESSVLRAACRHMLHVRPEDRLPSAAEYLKRLEQEPPTSPSSPSTAVQPLFLDPTIPPTVPRERMSHRHRTESATTVLPTRALRVMTDLVEKITVPLGKKSPDARLAVSLAHYPLILWETMGQCDLVGQAFLEKVLGKDSLVLPDSTNDNRPKTVVETTKTKTDASLQPTLVPAPATQSTKDLFAETENLLRQLESLNVEDLADFPEINSIINTNTHTNSATLIDDSNSHSIQQPVSIERTYMSQLCLIIYLQLILSLIRHLQRPASKLIALHLLHRLALYSSDEARLQRIVPFVVALLQDQDALVRAKALRVLTQCVVLTQHFSPSDAQIFPQYIFKRIAHLISDPSIGVRLVFSECLATLAETAHLFLDISHAVRLYEAVGSGSSTAAAAAAAAVTTTTKNTNNADVPVKTRPDDQIFNDDVAKLLDNQFLSKTSKSLEQTNEPETTSTFGSDQARSAAKTLISSTYQSDLTGLQESVARWVVQITTDQAESSALPKVALLKDIGRLCAFFGLDGVMTSILPQILAFLNDRKHSELRGALFDALPSVCRTIGRAATEEFVVPCVEIGLVDEEEQVVSNALACLARLVQFRLLSRSFFLAGCSSVTSSRAKKDLHKSFPKRYGALLIHPSEVVRCEAIKTFSNVFEAVGSPDAEVYIIPILQPLLRFQPSPGTLHSSLALQKCLQKTWSPTRFSELLEKCFADRATAAAATEGAWTSIGIQFKEDSKSAENKSMTATGKMAIDNENGSDQDPQLSFMLEYLHMLVRHTGKSLVKEVKSEDLVKSSLRNGIEGSAKLAQSIMFPRQDSSAQKGTVPDWYTTLRDAAANEKSLVTETAAIQSVSTLGHVYGLSIMGPLEGSSESIVAAAADDAKSTENKFDNIFNKRESENLERAYTGQWGSESLVEPDVVDTCLLMTKLKALKVPPLPPHLGDKVPPVLGFGIQGKVALKEGPSTDWKPRVNALIASSSRLQGHSAAVVRLAVSLDNTFFVSGSHDGTCRVWETSQLEDSVGILDCSLVYTGHSSQRTARVNDIALVERSHSVVSGDSNGIVRVWRVDTVASSGKTLSLQNDANKKVERARTVGTSEVRQVDPQEGEVLAVSQYNSPSASIITFATQKGLVHSWDLRSACEPFVLRHGPDLGYLTSVAMGSDRHWIVTGTNRGYLALWDIRFHQIAKLWRHSCMMPINRIATSEVAPPQMWGTRSASPVVRPFIFAASGPNECSMFDAITGSCRECFRTVDGDSRDIHAHVEEPPQLHDIAIAMRTFGVAPATKQYHHNQQPLASTINCMAGSIGGSAQSFLITGGSDSRIRFWDFSTPSKCFVVSGTPPHMPARPSFERIDFEGNKRVMLCRQPRSSFAVQQSSTTAMYQGQKKSDFYNFTDSIQDIKILDGALVSCSRDCTIKVFR